MRGQSGQFGLRERRGIGRRERGGRAAGIEELAAEGAERSRDPPREGGLQLADFLVALADDVFALANGYELVAEAFADLGDGLGAGLGQSGTLGAELVDLMVGEIDLVMQLAADALEPINLEVEGGHLFAGGGEQRLDLVPLGFAAGELGAEGVEGLFQIGGVVARGGVGSLELGGVSVGMVARLSDGFFEIGGVVARGGVRGFELGGVSVGMVARLDDSAFEMLCGVAARLGDNFFEIGGVGSGLVAGGGDLGETNFGGREGAGEVSRVGRGLAVAGLELPDVVAGQSLRF